VSGGARGSATETTPMPTTGGASYLGGAVGYVAQPANINTNNAGQFYGTSSLTANFAAGTVTGAITGITVYDTTNSSAIGSLNNIGLFGTFASGTSSYAGHANVIGGPGSAFDISGASGNLAGAFYGASAAETAGVFSLSGGTNSTEIIGSFGARQSGTQPTISTASNFNRVVTLAGSQGAFTGALAPTPVTSTIAVLAPDTSVDHFTTLTSIQTPGGTVVLQAGGANNFTSTSSRVGKTSVGEGDYAIFSSTDPAISTSGSGSFQGFAGTEGLQYTSFGVWTINMPTSCSFGSTKKCVPCAPDHP